MEQAFSDIIISWYQKHKRDLPWRDTKNPYVIWLSEVILQQTRVAQGFPYFTSFIKKYPTIKDLAATPEQEVLKLWQGLGYYSRARNLHTTAKYIVRDLKGNFPKTYKELLCLKGVGDYTASAIASFCYDEVTPTVDGNVYRVLARFFGIATPINTSSAKNEFKLLAQELIDKENPALFNQAIMEFGALQCVSNSPDCRICPLASSCKALQDNQVAVLPKKDKKRKARKRFINYLVIQTSDKKTCLKKRTGKGIWQNLYEFPFIETNEEVDFKVLLQHQDFNRLTEKQDFTLQLLTPKGVVHKLSHQHLYIKFWLLETESWQGTILTWEQAKALPTPIVIHNFMEDFIL
jgi:A/G-specific adenine glycosylase